METTRFATSTLRVRAISLLAALAMAATVLTAAVAPAYAAGPEAPMARAGCVY